MSLIAHNLGIAFDGTWIFRNVSLTVESGNRVALVGPSGSGKSLLLKSLAMLQSVDEGYVEWQREKISGSRVPGFRGEVMYVPQRSADSDGTVEDFLSTPFSFAAHADKTFDRSVALKQIQQLGRGDKFLAKSQRELSGGERQIAAIVRALILAPSLLLLDEPTSAMDGETAAAAEALIDAWCDGEPSRSTVWVTHDRQQAQRVSERVVEMNQLESTT
ncbi:ABC transporter ATP-binding protein [Mariniblastus fucicola]|uniref:L-cystine import ATP-binding protein TcyN n=1 Tax=Mariniblastus fucicola TaxID=980251 RepID=A0A5B9PEZ9_9BACT|nr:ATP-binding cassette domain-containing protein [Mariniblastus fucicola]QEG23750.1 L-cystine import ATP-binding protein TcyN [Mariniblastus fucicola]